MLWRANLLKEPYLNIIPLWQVTFLGGVIKITHFWVRKSWSASIFPQADTFQQGYFVLIFPVLNNYVSIGSGTIIDYTNV